MRRNAGGAPTSAGVTPLRRPRRPRLRARDPDSGLSACLLTVASTDLSRIAGCEQDRGPTPRDAQAPVPARNRKSGYPGPSACPSGPQRSLTASHPVSLTSQRRRRGARGERSSSTKPPVPDHLGPCGGMAFAGLGTTSAVCAPRGGLGSHASLLCLHSARWPVRS